MADTARGPRSDLERGWAYYQGGDYQKALKLLQNAAESLPAEALAHYRLGFCLRTLGQHTNALEAFRAAAGRLPRDPWPLFQVAKELLFIGKPSEALLGYAGALERNHRFTEAYNDLGAVLAKLGFYELSAAAYTIFSVLADMAIQITGSSPIPLRIFDASVTVLKGILGDQYSQIHGSIFERLGDPLKGEIDLSGFDLLAIQMVAAIRRIVQDGLQDEGWVMPPVAPTENRKR
jgi:tetratricopeptide (TPR) repeat protein